MKKNVLRILAAILALAMVFSLAACGNDDKSSSPSSSSSAADDSSSSSAADNSSSEAEANADGTFATVKAFLEDPETKAALDETIAQMVGEDDSMTVSIDGTDDSLVYTFTFNEEAMAAVDEDALKEALDAGMDGIASVFEEIAESVASVVAVDNVKVVVVYAKPDGSDLVRREFTAQ